MITSQICYGVSILRIYQGCFHGLSFSVVGHRSIATGFKPRPGYVRRVFHLSLRLVTFGGRSAHLAYLVHKSGCKTSTFTFSVTYLSCLECYFRRRTEPVVTGVITYKMKGFRLKSLRRTQSSDRSITSHIHNHCIKQHNMEYVLVCVCIHSSHRTLHLVCLLK